MNNIPTKLRQELAEDPIYRRCLRARILDDHYCIGDPIAYPKKIEWEHAIIHAGKQVQKRWAIIPICWWAHRGPGLEKEINIWLALNRATDEELAEFPRTDWIQKRKYLNSKYGDPRPNPLLK